MAFAVALFTLMFRSLMVMNSESKVDAQALSHRQFLCNLELSHWDRLRRALLAGSVDKAQRFSCRIAAKAVYGYSTTGNASALRQALIASCIPEWQSRFCNHWRRGWLVEQRRTA